VLTLLCARLSPVTNSPLNTVYLDVVIFGQNDSHTLEHKFFFEELTKFDMLGVYYRLRRSLYNFWTPYQSRAIWVLRCTRHPCTKSAHWIFQTFASRDTCDQQLFHTNRGLCSSESINSSRVFNRTACSVKSRSVCSILYVIVFTISSLFFH